MPSGMGALTSLRTLNRFIVGPQKLKDSASLEDLEPLSKLQGDLMIQISEMMTLEKEGHDDAFLLKKRLKKLKIEWPSFRSDENLQNDMNIFGKLQPHSDLEDFTLYGYESLRFPLWVPMDDLASVLPNLISIIIDQCTGCQHLPSFSKLRCLKRLTLCNLLSLEYIEENTSNALFFPSLEYLWLMELPELKGWCRRLAIDANDSEQERSSLLPPFPHLSDLYIYGCPCLKLASMPLSSIKEFFFKGEDEDIITLKAGKAHTSSQFRTNDANLVLSFPWDQYCQRYLGGNPVSLVMKVSTGFDIQATNTNEGFRRMSNHLVSLQIQNEQISRIILKNIKHLTALQELIIVKHVRSEIRSTLLGPVVLNESYTSLEETQDDEIPWQGLQRLQLLSLLRIARMEKLPEGIQFLTSLQVLGIVCCDFLKVDDSEMPWRGLQSLQRLSLDRLPKIEKLPEGIQFLTSLQELCIESCCFSKGDDSEMPWRGLQSLQHLSLSDLPRIERLPEGIQFLTSLQELHIQKCPRFTATSDDELSWKGLRSLHYLSLNNLRGMKRLPQAIQFLTSLKKLCIKQCDNLTIPEWVNPDILR